jgi:hypothetical protein
MKATLTFDLPEERSEHHDAIHGGEWRGIVWDFDQWLKGRLKHSELNQTEAEILEEIRDKIYEIVGDYSLDIYQE